jgi:hypothetical protein
MAIQMSIDALPSAVPDGSPPRLAVWHIAASEKAFRLLL